MAVGAVLTVANQGHAAEQSTVPQYLRGYGDAFARDPRGANLQWFRDAKLGLFVHYNNTSLLPGSKYDPLPEGVTFEALSQQFRAERFNAEAISDLALAAGMRYVCFTPYHGGGPYLWQSEFGRPNSCELPAGRDLVAELTRACADRGLGYFHYVHVSVGQSHDAVWEKNSGMLRELGTNYGPIAGWWFDTSHRYYSNPEFYPRLKETYALIRTLQPHSLISFCEGLTGEEDYVTFEHEYRLLENYQQMPRELLPQLSGKPVEICTTLQYDRPGGRGTRMWFNVDRAHHRDIDDVWEHLRKVRRSGANFLLNTGPVADGSVHPADVATLQALGQRLREEGFPR